MIALYRHSSSTKFRPYSVTCCRNNWARTWHRALRILTYSTQPPPPFSDPSPNQLSLSSGGGLGGGPGGKFSVLGSSRVHDKVLWNQLSGEQAGESSTTRSMAPLFSYSTFAMSIMAEQRFHQNVNGLARMSHLRNVSAEETWRFRTRGEIRTAKHPVRLGALDVAWIACTVVANKPQATTTIRATRSGI
eukprot:SAG31_NODE_12883_length_909_cov_1.080247_1_plen_190_part_00